MRFLRWIGGGVVAAGAVLAAFLATANAQQGWAIYVQRGAGVVLSAGQKTAAANWARSVWPSIVAANLSSVTCEHLVEVTCDLGQTCSPEAGCVPCERTVDYAGHWVCSACENVTLTDAEYLDEKLSGLDAVSDGQRCHFADTSPPDASPRGRVPVLLAPAQVATLVTAARSLGGLSGDDIPVGLTLLRVAGSAVVAAEVHKLVTAPAATFRVADRIAKDQPGAVVQLIGKVQ